MTLSMRTLFATVFLLLPVVGLAQTRGPAYRSHTELTKALQDLQSRHRDIVHLESIGKTLGERDIWVVGLRNGDPAQHRAMLIVGGVEPTQIAGSELAFQAVEYFATHYGTDDSITHLLNTTTIYVLPRVSPDATESFFAKVRCEQSTNARPTDDDRDGATDEDGADDLNGDGMITLMRIKDPQGEWMLHPEDPRVMKKAALTKNERGEYTLYTEGIDNDKDEKWNEDPVGGVNVNKNFTFNYEFFTEGAGVYQVSEAESRAVADFVFSHPSIAVIVSFSPNDNLMSPWTSDPRASSEGRGVVSSVAKEDEEYFQFIGKMFQDMTGFKDAPKGEKGHGAFSEWAYYHAGRWSFSTWPWWAPGAKATRDSAAPDGRRAPGGGTPTRGGRSEDQDDESALMIRTLQWYEAAGMPEIFIPWERFDHPDFQDKDVEIGGFKPFAMHNPPADSLVAIARSFNAFFTDVAGKLPSISIKNVKTKTLKAGVYRITADIANDGYLPTNSAIGHRLRWVRDVALTLELAKGQSLASGTARQVLDPIGGNGSSVAVSWVVVAPSGSVVTVRAESPTCGISSQRIELR